MSDQMVVCCESTVKAAPYIRALVVMGISEEQLVVVTPEETEGNLKHLGARVAGLVLCGGPDLAPERYGEKSRDDPDLWVMPELDKLDLELLEGAANGMTPVWAICRGMQIVNVFQGGSLWQDLPTQFNGVIDHSPEGPHDAVVHAIEAVSESDSFADFLSSKDLQVNSRHHQAVKDLGENVQVLAKSPDGVVEVLALESETWWVKGVQWHPENLMDLEIQRALWNEFLEATTQAKVETNRHSPSGGSHHHE